MQKAPFLKCKPEDFQIEEATSPSHTRGRGRIERFPFSQLEVSKKVGGLLKGPSFFVAEDIAIESQVRSSAGNWGRVQKPIRKFSVQRVEENGVKGVRVWRSQ